MTARRLLFTKFYFVTGKQRQESQRCDSEGNRTTQTGKVSFETNQYSLAILYYKARNQTELIS